MISWKRFNPYSLNECYHTTIICCNLLENNETIKYAINLFLYKHKYVYVIVILCKTKKIHKLKPILLKASSLP